MARVNISIVLFNNDISEVQNCIVSILKAELDVQIYLIDNSPTDRLKLLAQDQKVLYYFNNMNLGYGKGHNIAISNSIKECINYHIILNPDISFQVGVLENIYAYMESNRDVGSLMPKVYYEDGSLQRLCKLLPTPFDLIGRRFFPKWSWAKKQNEKYELHNFNYNSILNTPCLSGCFMFIRTSVFERAGLFDPRYFMYLEDYDLTRRIHKTAKTIFYPEVSIIHGHAKESYKDGKLLKIHMQSAIRYFNKWGWFGDKERKDFNKKVLDYIDENS